MRRVLGAIVAVVLAACAAPGVRTESAVEQATPPPPTAPVVTSPEPTAPPAPEPNPPDDTTAPSEPPEEPEEPEGPAPTTEVDDGVEGIGDDLFPDLGTDDLDVESYDVRLAYDPGTQTLDGAVTLQAVVVGSPEQIVLDAVEIDVQSVTVDGAAADFELAGGEVVITPATAVPAGATVAIDVQYSDQAQPAGPFAGLEELGVFATADGLVRPQPARRRADTGCRATTTRRTRPRGGSR